MALLDLAEALTRTPSTDEIATRVSRAATALTGSPRASVLVWDPDDGLLVRRGGPYDDALDGPSSAPLSSSVVETMVRRPGAMSIRPGCTGVLQAVGQLAAITAGTAVPLVAGGTLFGVLVVEHLDPDRPPAGLAERLPGLAALAATGLENAELVRLLRHQAEHDSLTGLPTLRLVERLAVAGLADSRRRGAPIVVLFVDIDHFRAVNDRLGHAAGDRLLVQAARRLRAVVRGADAVGRVGGDEFVVVLTQVGHLEGAKVVAERIVRSLGDPFSLDGVIVTVGASVGVALSSPEDLSLAGPLARADAAMDRAKQAGRGRVVVDGSGVLEPQERPELAERPGRSTDLR